MKLEAESKLYNNAISNYIIKLYSNVHTTSNNIYKPGPDK